MELNRAHITVQYADGCFCEREKLKAGFSFAIERRFNFAAEAKKRANELGLINFQLGKYKSAMAQLHQPCCHRDVQHVRLSWELVY